MEKEIEQNIEKWKKLLLDFSKRNRLFNFRPTKRTTVEISLPDINELYGKLVVENKTLQFIYPESDEADDGISYSRESVTRTVDIQNGIQVKKPDSASELRISLDSLKKRAKSALEEQGIHVLYLICGLLKWKESQNSEIEISSPLILVPVQLYRVDLASPFKLVFHDSEEVVLNPTLKHKLLHDFEISLPDFDVSNDKPKEYLKKIEDKVASIGTVERSVHMTLLSFLKMCMYEDINRNGDRLSSNPHIRALCEVSNSEGVDEPWNFGQFDHDKDTKPHEVYQILDADASQMDAILAAKRGVSFVLQGPPGTGKSQTIANIIAETLADGKKVLFVSEKRAALEVVYNRLHYAGLGDFCFTLHDHKASRREILNQLQRVMDKTTNRRPAQDIEALNVLQRRREELNRYHNELHTPCSGYNASVFQMIGELAKLSHVPDVIFDIPNVKLITKDYIKEQCALLHRLASIIRDRKEDYKDNCWRYSTAESLTQTLSHDIDAHLLPLIPRLRALRSVLADFNSKHDIDLAYTADSLPQYEEVLQIAPENPGILSHWIEQSSIENLTEGTHKWESIINEVKQKREDLASWYSQEFFGIEPVGYLDYLKAGVDYLLGFFRVENLDSFIASLSSIVQELASIKESMDSVFAEAEDISTALGVGCPGTRKEIHRFVDLCDILKSLAAIPASWFDSTIFTQVKQSTPTYSHKHDRLRTIEKQIEQNYDAGIYELDYDGLLRRFRTEYSSVLKFFKPSYYRDLKEIKAHYKHSSGLRNDQIHNVLNSLKDRDATLKDIEKDWNRLSQYYGAHYSGVDSDWRKIKDLVEDFGKIIEIVPTIPDAFKELLQSGNLPVPELMHFLNTWQNIVPVKLYTRINEVCTEPIEQDKEYKAYSDRYGEVIKVASDFLQYYSGIAQLRKQQEQYTRVMQDIEILQRLLECEKELETNHDALTRCYGFYYRGLETDWESTRAALKYSINLKKVVQKYDLGETFIAHFCSDASMTKSCGELLEQVKNERKGIEEDLKWFADLFPVDMQKLIYSMDFLDLSNFAERCQLHKYQLEEWIDFRTQRKLCADAGLEEYIQYVENNTIPTDFIEDGYRKRFYILWLDAIKTQFPALNNFRGVLHEDLINQFRKLDTQQFEIAVKRIQNKLWAGLPNFNIRYSRGDEVTILKKELQKKHRLKALRRLFGEIPNLAMTLKPCFMMSPLSVSVFLESNAYNFDLVIFDEASQVHTEDAIGAIMRGKQVVIVGDDKQLPPTSFFRSTMSADDFEDEDPDEIDSGAVYESILSEAKVKGFREHSLKWHYRSRQEDLITFSNIKFYDRKLITFPSITLKAPDCGVEFVHVADGCYEQKKNPREACKVAELVFEHFRKYGKSRSLGVVAFSEAQQSAIEAAIIEYRRRDNCYESFFNEDVEAAFFVKNLENVQGDERDTIIFSVGYAKTETGQMHMRFGPLNIKDVGGRRLNVAITRAKHNVKLVASILPTDIDISKTQSEGVRLLRSYMEFAQLGVKALRNEASYNSQEDRIESPFEQSVYDYLSSQGYQVQAQVGCSGYRIDMAVKHPLFHGKYAIGIECDGASYHSSRTARERDRLRQAILEDMGWKIYRIWSTDWIKSPEEQKKKLKATVEAAFVMNSIIPPSSAENIVKEDNNDTTLPTSDIPLKPVLSETVQTEFDLEGQADFHSYGFVEYEYATLNQQWNQRNVGTAIFHIIEIEQPIHIYELAKRLLPLFNRQKITGAYRDEVEAIVNKLPKSKKIKRVGDFLQLSNFSGVKVRVPGSDSSVRDIEYIPPKEIELAFVSIIRKTFGISKNELFKITANQFGFKRLGGNIKEIFDKVYKSALRYKKFTEIKGKVSI